MRAITASYNSIIVLLLAVLSGVASASVVCPTSNGAGPLSDIDVFDGPPEEMASLIPSPGYWDLRGSATSAHGYFLVCRYDAPPHSVVIPLPKTITICAFDDRWPRVVCR